ncbi:MAG TPA: UDP-N-acetylglucosamine 2-epimerase, partial [Elusimicrobiales bacterium]|nr:UDP-N-acetylglucosamine 2-epimerase [Elusimicrobiales bacterium]
MASYKSGKRRILVVMGTRPEVIKLAPVIMALKRRRGEIETVVCTTGQHRQILDQMLGVFDIKPDFDLNLMKPDQTLPGLLQSALRELNKVTDEVRPDMTVVQGDTLTATAAALSSYYARVPVAHVEAGLRSFNMRMP